MKWNEMKSSYSLNSFKLFIVVWGLCLTISKMLVESFILSHSLCIHDCSDGDACSKRWLSIQSGMILYITCEFFTHHHLSQIYAVAAATAASAEV